jgi:DNA-binding NarL/FixJ family response regulator
VTVGVLLVDDVVDVRRLVRTALRFRGGFEVLGEAGNGAEAVDLATRLQPDLVVLDLGLPDLAGREVLTRIRDACPRTKVVVFSSTDPDDETWVRENVEGYVLKDETLDYLVGLMETVRPPVTDEAEIELPLALTSPAEARRFVTRTAAEWTLDQELLDDALLVVSELAANGVTHGRSALRLKVSLKPAALRIEVMDHGSGTPEPQPPTQTEEHGRGLHMVGVLTSAWGMESLDTTGKLVWAELPRRVPEKSVPPE